jgi:hypothetical protein
VSLPRADALAAGLVGRPVRSYLGFEARVVAIADGVVVVADDRGNERAQVVVADLQAGLDRLDAEGEVAVTIGALGPGATWVAAMLAEVEGAAYDASSARVKLARPEP